MLRFLCEVIWVWRGRAPANACQAQPLCPALPCPAQPSTSHYGHHVCSQKRTQRPLYRALHEPYSGFKVLFGCPIWLPYCSHPYSLFLLPIPVPNLVAFLFPPLDTIPLAYSVFLFTIRLAQVLQHFVQRSVFRPSFVQNHMFSLRPGFGKLLSRPGAGSPAPQLAAPGPGSMGLMWLELQQIC